MDPLKYIVPGRKRLPYGMMNFADIRLDNYYYVDKTRFIPMIEEADRFFFFIRPRRYCNTTTTCAPATSLRHSLVTSTSGSIPHRTATAIWCYISTSPASSAS